MSFSNPTYTGQLTFTKGTGGARDTITRTDGGSWFNLGFNNNDFVAITGAASKNGNYKISSVAGNVLTLHRNHNRER